MKYGKWAALAAIGLLQSAASAAVTCELREAVLGTELPHAELTVIGTSATLQGWAGTQTFYCDRQSREVWRLDCTGTYPGFPTTLTQLRAVSLEPGAPVAALRRATQYPTKVGENFAAIDLYTVISCEKR